MRLGILVGVKDINIEKVGGQPQTARDWSPDFANLPFVGGHRWRHKVYFSGALTVGAATSITTLSVSGIGFQLGQLYHYSSGIPNSNAFTEFSIDGLGYRSSESHGYFDIGYLGVYGLGSVGWHLNRIRVHQWDTVNNVYSVLNYFLPPRMYFRSYLSNRLRNSHPTDPSTQDVNIAYNLFVSSKRILCKLPRFIDAGTLRKKAGSKQSIHPLVVELLGYFEKEEEHPYGDYLADIPNEWDVETTLPDGSIVRSASPAKAKTVLTLIVPEDWTTKKALGKIKVSKVLEE